MARRCVFSKCLEQVEVKVLNSRQVQIVLNACMPGLSQAGLLASLQCTCCQQTQSGSVLAAGVSLWHSGLKPVQVLSGRTLAACSLSCSCLRPAGGNDGLPHSFLTRSFACRGVSLGRALGASRCRPSHSGSPPRGAAARMRLAAGSCCASRVHAQRRSGSS